MPINSYCASVRYRFAVSEASYLEQLRGAFLGDNAALSSIGNILPRGGIDSMCILQSLHEALALEGPLNSIFAIIDKVPGHRWLLDFVFSTMPFCYKGIQTAVLKILSLDESCAVLNSFCMINVLFLSRLIAVELHASSMSRFLKLRHFSKTLVRFCECVG